MGRFLFLAILGVLDCCGRPAEAAAEQSFTVLVFNYAGVPQSVLERAEREAGRIVGSAGVRLRWLNCSDQSGEAAAGCTQSPGSLQVLLHLLPRTATRRLAEPGSFGFALPLADDGPGFFAGVFCDRVAQLVTPRVGEATILGHVLAHEIGHLFLGANRHSASGIMKADWRHADVERAGQGRLTFSGAERRRISENLKLRRGSLAAAASRRPLVPR
jgi:hypothetical protein